MKSYKSLKRTVLDSISPLLNKVDDDKMYLVYPALYDALVQRGLIKDIVKPVETVKPHIKPEEKDFKMPVYAWELKEKDGIPYKGSKVKYPNGKGIEPKIDSTPPLNKERGA